MIALKGPHKGTFQYLTPLNGLCSTCQEHVKLEHPVWLNLWSNQFFFNACCSYTYIKFALLQFD